MPLFQTSSGSGVSAATVDAALGIYSVKDYGAVGNGTNNDTAAIQAAIDAAAAVGNAANATGAIAYFPPGAYSIRNPLVLPRTGTTPTEAVWLAGANMRSSQIIGHSSFPTTRALIEWEVATARAWCQRIENLTLVCPNVIDTRAIHYDRVSTGTLHDDYDAERCQIDLFNIAIEASNQYHASAIRIEGGIWYSRWETVRGDFTTGTHLYDTLLIELDSEIDASQDMTGSVGEPGWTTDVPGFSYGIMRDIHAGGRRGGYSQCIKGRLLRSTVESTFANGGSLEASIMYDLKNCVGNVFSQLGNEGQTEGSQIRLTNGRFNRFNLFNLGTPDAEAIGLNIINSTDNVFDTRLAYSNQPAFSSVAGSLLLSLDATSKRNFFYRLGVAFDGDINDEIVDGGDDNYIEGITDATATGGGAIFTMGENPYAPAPSIPDQTGHDGEFLTTNGTATSWGSTPGAIDPYTTYNEFDDFMAGSTSSGQIGKMGWSALNGSRTNISSEAGHPGLLQLSTGASSGTVASVELAAAANGNSIYASEMFDITFIIRLNNNDANTTLRAGISANGSSATPAAAAYFEKLDGDTNWFRITRNSSVQTRTDTTIGVSTSFVKLRVRRIDASTIGFTINANAEQTLTTNLPAGSGLAPFVQITNSAASAKTVDLDFAQIIVTGISR